MARRRSPPEVVAPDAPEVVAPEVAAARVPRLSGPSPAAIQKGSERKRRNSLFSRYLRAGAVTARRTKQAAELARLRAELASGTRERSIPLFTDLPQPHTSPTGVITLRRERLRNEDGTAQTAVEQRPLLPHERLARLAEIKRLEGMGGDGGGEKLRAQFLEMLPSYAADTGANAEVLRMCGVSDVDLLACGLLEE